VRGAGVVRMSDIQMMGEEQLRVELRKARTELLKEKQKRIIAEEQLQTLRVSTAEAVQQVEAEEEFITNTLMKRLSQLKQEKEKLALQIEEEEEFLTNTLQMKLDKLKREKIEIESQMEQEQEYIVNKLQRQLDELKVENAQLGRRVEELSQPGSPRPSLVTTAPQSPMSSSSNALRARMGSFGEQANSSSSQAE